MAKLAFFFDPVCPWAWRTSLWAREVARQVEVDIQWRVLSLAEINRGGDPLADAHAQSDPGLRTLMLARRQGGNQAVDRLYLALGRARHERHENLNEASVIEAALEEAGLERGLYSQAMDDPSTGEEVRAEHREAVERFGAFGVPWLVLGENQYGFFGPVISDVPTGARALQLWEHAGWMLDQPYLYEFKRAR